MFAGQPRTKGLFSLLFSIAREGIKTRLVLQAAYIVIFLISALKTSP